MGTEMVGNKMMREGWLLWRQAFLYDLQEASGGEGLVPGSSRPNQHLTAKKSIVPMYVTCPRE